ncbi:MAG: PKD domain-containing protein [Bacteroidia bacterium]
MKKFIRLSVFILFVNLPKTYAQLQADFVADTTQGCAPLDSVQFTDLSTGNPTSWNWNFGNSNTSTLQNPQASYPNSGVYTVTLTVGNSTTTSTITKTAYITVYKIPVAHFTYTPPLPCTNSIVTFTDNSTIGDGPIVSWNWGFGDGTIQTTATNATTHSYSLPLNSVPVSVIVTDSHGCESDFDTLITVKEKPIVGFKATPLINCHIPTTVIFTDTSTTSGTVTRLWDFGDGGSSTLQNPSHTYTAAGFYYVKLVIYQGSCSDSLLKLSYVFVENHTASFTAANTTVCVGDTVHFTDTSTPPSALSIWNFGDLGMGNGTAIGHVYSAPGTYTVKLNAYDAVGCMDSLIKTNYITVNPQPVAGFTANDTLSCSVPFIVSFSSTSTGITNWSWNFGDNGTSTSQNPSHTFLSPGSYTVTLIVTNANGCKDTLIKAGYINIIPPLADFHFTPKKGCAPLTVNFTSTSSAIEPFANYTWSFGDASPVMVTTVGNTIHTYTNPGVYTVSLIVNTINGCKDTLVKVDSVLVGFHPNSGFTVSEDTICAHESVQFSFNNTNVNSWAWYFGDGGVDSTNHNPIHQYADTGTFIISFVNCNNGCCDTGHFTITILPPIAKFTLVGSCAAPYTITCTSQSIGADSLVWNFGDGTIVSNTNPISHTYASRGWDTITIYVFNFTTGCMDSLVQTYKVTDPIAHFRGTPLDFCYPGNVAFTDTSQDGVLFTWNYGDGSPSITTAAITYGHMYSLPGYYTVKEIVSDIHGCKDSLTKINYVHLFGPLPGFTVNKDTGCAPLSVIFSDTSHLHSEYSIVSYIWNFGDGNIDTLTNFNPVPHIYLNPGSYTVTLTVTDSHGCTKTITMPNFIQPTLPIAAFVVDTFSCPGKVITFNASASAAIGGTYQWLFGDATPLFVTTSNTATHTYANNGNYTVTLTRIDQNGCDSTITHNIHIENPVADFSITAVSSCGNAQVTFYNLSTGTAITSVFWDFGNGATSVNLGTTYNNYVNAGYYTVSLIVTNSAGCKDTITKDSIVVVPGPIGSFDFYPKEGCSPLEVTFIANSPNTINYNWDFADGTGLTTTGNTVTHIYYQDITAHPKLTISSYLPATSTLCTDTAHLTSTNDSVFIQTFSNVGIIADGDSNATVIEVSEGDEIPLSVLTDITGGSTSYLWYPSSGTGIGCDTCSVTTLTGTGFEGYIYLTVDKVGGCNGKDSILVKFVPCDSHMNTPNIFTPNGDGHNDEFYIEHPCPENFLLTIYNRWGQEVFKTSDPVEKWDGRSGNGDYVPSGTYYWILASRDKSMKGFLQLIREKKN